MMMNLLIALVFGVTLSMCAAFARTLPSTFGMTSSASATGERISCEMCSSLSSQRGYESGRVRELPCEDGF